MNVHLCLLQDLSKSLCDMEDVLDYQESKNDYEQASMLRDARIYTFLRCTVILKVFFFNIYEENDFEDTEEVNEIENLVLFFAEQGIIDQKESIAFNNLFGLAQLLELERYWFDEGDEVTIYDQGIEAIPEFYNFMCDFFQKMEGKWEAVIHDGDEDDDIH